MTKKAFRELVKKAKMSAKEKAEELAIMAGKPTSTGVAAGAGLAALLASMGMLSRSGENPKNTSVLSNPLLLGSLGAAGGYLAGNALDRAPARRANKDLSWLSIASLLGGAGVLGTNLAKEEGAEQLKAVEQDFANASRHVPQRPDLDGGIRYFPGFEEVATTTGKGKNKKVKTEIKPIADRVKQRQAMNEFREAQEAYHTGLLRAGKLERALKEGYIPKSTAIDRLVEAFKHSPKSPYRWLSAGMPWPGKKLLERLYNVAVKHPTSTSLAGLALLAGGGKAIYDKVHD